MNKKCDLCCSKAVWFYLPGTSQYCDTCVPRGCSCNIDIDGEEHFDTDGRKLPCVEYLYDDGEEDDS